MTVRGRVLIAGGGIGGLAVAVALHRQGFEPLVLEQADEIREVGAAIGVQTNAVRALHDIGVAEDVLAAGMPVEHYQYVSWRGRLLASWPQGDIGRRIHGEAPVIMLRGRLQQTLLNRLPEGAVQLGSQCVGFAEDSEGVTVRLAGGREERGDVLLGADGLHSVVRGQLLGKAAPRYAGWIALRGVAPSFHHPSFPLGLARQSLGRGRSFGMWHVSDGRVYWSGSTTMPEHDTDVAGVARKRLVQERFASGPEPVAALIEATPAEAILRNNIYDRLPVNRWSSGRVVLLGDAAHPTTPGTGQGGSQAIIDASVLANELNTLPNLRATGPISSAFRAYEARRIPVTSTITLEAWHLGVMHHVSNPILCWRRDLALRLTPSRVWQRRIEKRMTF